MSINFFPGSQMDPENPCISFLNTFLEEGRTEKRKKMRYPLKESGDTDVTSVQKTR